MDKIPMCPSCGTTKSGTSAKKCSKCGRITCTKCSFTGCSCGHTSYKERYVIS